MMKVLIVDFDFFTSVGGGQVFYRRVVERDPDIQFFYPSRGPDLEKRSSLPPNAEPFAFGDRVPSVWAEFATQNSHQEAYYFQILWNVAVPLQGMRFDVVDIPSFFPCGRYARPIFNSLGIVVDRLCVSMLGWLSTSLVNGYASDWNKDLIEEVTRAEQSTGQSADIRYTISDMHLAENAAIQLPIETVDMNNVLEDFPLPPPTPPGKGPPDLWYLGRLDGAKGPDLFLEIVSRVASHLYSNCYLAGPDNEWTKDERWSGQLMRRVSELGIRATYVGCLAGNEIRERVYGGRCVLVVPSRTDAFNYVAIEALRNGCPILLSNRAGVAGFLAKRHQSLLPELIDPKDISDSAGKLHRILENYDDCARSLRSRLREYPFPRPRPGFMKEIYRSKPRRDLSIGPRAADEARRLVSRIPLMEPSCISSRPRMSRRAEPQVSVIIPTFNRASLLALTIAALARQSFSDFEIVVIDDGSSDGGLVRRVVESYAPLTTYVRQPNAGEAAAVNRGLQEARGALIGILSDDDAYAPDLLQKIAPELNKHPEAIGAYPDWDIIDEAGHLVEEHRLPAFNRDALLFWQWCLPGPGTIARRDVLLRIGGRDSGFRFISDYDMWIRATRLGTMIHIPQKLAYWRLHGSNATMARKTAMARERLRLAKKILSDKAEASLGHIERRKVRASAHLAAAAILGVTAPIRAGWHLFRAGQLAPDLLSNLPPNMKGYPEIWPRWHATISNIGRTTSWAVTEW